MKLSFHMRKLHSHAYLAGYSGWSMPRLLRKLIAGSEIHRAWLLGWLGYFSQDGTAFGPALPYGSRAALTLQAERSNATTARGVRDD